MHLDARSTCDLGLVAYDEGLRVQREFAARRAAGAIGDTLLLCAHPSVYTLGTNADPAFVTRAGDVPVVRTDRGGEVTWHGPGQVVGYAICDLEPRGRDLHAFCRDLEEVMLRTLADFGLAAERDAGRTGVWTAGRKIGALGVRVRKWISTHGFALNVNCDLDAYAGIVPCGLENCDVTSMARELHAPVPEERVKAACARHFEDIFLG